MRDEPEQSKQSDQPDDSEPTPERQAELRAAYRVTAAVRRGDLVEARLLAPERPHPSAAPAPATLEEAYLLFADAPATAGAVAALG